MRVGAPRLGFSPEAVAPELQDVAGPTGGSWKCHVASFFCRHTWALAGCPGLLCCCLGKLGGDGMEWEWGY